MKIIAGVDEVGRGSLIGPVYAAAVILNKSIKKKLLKDSKKLTKPRREFLSKYIKKKLYMVYRESICQRNRKNQYSSSKLISYAKSHKKIKKKT